MILEQYLNDDGTINSLVAVCEKCKNPFQIPNIIQYTQNIIPPNHVMYRCTCGHEIQKDVTALNIAGIMNHDLFNHLDKCIK